MRSSGVFPSGVAKPGGKRLLLAGVEVNATLLDPKTPQELENRRKNRRNLLVLTTLSSNRLILKGLSDTPKKLNRME
jgi:hypothetical protein